MGSQLFSQRFFLRGGIAQALGSCSVDISSYGFQVGPEKAVMGRQFAPSFDLRQRLAFGLFSALR